MTDNRPHTEILTVPLDYLLSPFHRYSHDVMRER